MKEHFQYIELINTQAKMKMKAQANKLVLSYIWWVLEPLLLISLFYLVFGHILQRGGDDFLSFLIIGKIIFTWFSKSVVSASNSLPQNKGIIGQRALPKWIFPMVNIQESMYKSLFSFLIMFFLILNQGYEITINWVQIIPLTAVMYIFICSVGMFFSILVAIAKDFSNLISLCMMGLMFGSGIFWDVNTLPNEELKYLILKLNPLASLVSFYRDIMMHNQWIDFNILLNVLLISFAILFSSLIVLKKYNNQITRSLFS